MRLPLLGLEYRLTRFGKDGGVATAKTNSHGVARFKAIPPRIYVPDSPDGVLFPSGDALIVVPAGHAPPETVELDWPNHSIATRILRGKFTVSEQLSALSTHYGMRCSNFEMSIRQN